MEGSEARDVARPARPAGEEVERDWHELADLSELVDLGRNGSGSTFEVAERRIALFHTEGGLFALDDAGPHRGASLGMGVALEGEVTCPWHGFHFRLADGTSGDGLEDCVEVFPVRVGEAGKVSVGLPKSL
jgi:nitrite reductase/ring-hydroxylating ferredoxin subunit